MLLWIVFFHFAKGKGREEIFLWHLHNIEFEGPSQDMGLDLVTTFS
jgi:hypothetical protein